jgi:hypothetical protein
VESSLTKVGSAIALASELCRDVELLEFAKHGNFTTAGAPEQAKWSKINRKMRTVRGGTCV